MAKKKLLEEMLTEAVIDNANAPYTTPENWIWIKFGHVLKVSSGGGLTQKNMNTEGSIPVYGGNGLAGVHDESNIDERTIIIGRVGAKCGNVHITEKQAWVTDNAFITKYPNDLFNKQYLYQLLKVANLGQYNKSSAQPVISGKKIEHVPLIVPPFTEQQRIVNRIEFYSRKLIKLRN